MTPDTPEPTQTNQWVICVVALETRSPRKYANYFMAVEGDRAAAEKMQAVVAKKGFKVEGRRYFPDEIESLNIKQSGATDEVS